MKISCKHKEIVMVNCTGDKLEDGAYEIDFCIRCHICDKELFRISEYGRSIINLSKH